MTVRPIWVLIKAVLLFILINVIFAWTEPPAGKLSVYNWLVPGRVRVPYEKTPELFSVGYNSPVFDDFDAMFRATKIANPKQQDEYRVVMLGDSSLWGWGVTADNSLPEQLNRLEVRSCDGRQMVFYNLAYPWPYMYRDLLLLDEAQKYEPDMVIWMLTLYSFQHKDIEYYFLEPHSDQALALFSRYDLEADFKERLQPVTFFDKTIVGQRKRLKNIFQVQVNGFLWAATGIDFHNRDLPGTSNLSVEADPLYFDHPPEDLDEILGKMSLDVLAAGYELTGDQALLVVLNEPIFIAEGENSAVRYSSFYPRWVYDGYREYLSDWMRKNDYIFLDYWDLLPVSEFADQEFHRTHAGEQHLAEALAEDIVVITCPLQ
ncbi:MAG: hypothetical protein JXA13_06935 [Anaerolineales bacterium]|nr:hypothetical protein [Anaerolineales bacterium]